MLRIRVLFTSCVLFALSSLLSVELKAGVLSEMNEEDIESMAFMKESMPRFHEELLVILKGVPSIREEVLKTVRQIHLDYLRYAEMKPELAAVFLTIKRREYENQLKAEALLGMTDPEKRARAFQQLADHMNVTFDLNLRLVTGELAWLENEVRHLREVIGDEKSNKKLILKEDLVSLLLRNDPLLQVSIRGLGSSKSEDQRREFQSLIKDLPPKGQLEALDIE